MLYVRPGIVGGGETYARGLINGLRELKLAYNFVVFLNRLAYPTFSELEEEPRFRRVLCSTPLNPIARHFWEQLRLEKLCREYGVDLLHSLGNVTPLFASLLKVVTIHDLIYERSAATIGFLKHYGFRILLPRSANASDAVLTVSAFSKNELVEKVGVDPRKIFVTPEGPGQEWGDRAPWEEVQKKYSIPENFFLAVGTGAAKRLDLTAAALQQLKERGKDVHLVVVGFVDRDLGSLTRQGNIHVLGYVPRDELAALFQKAIALVCASDVEGFGLPVLEAMMLGTPVIALDRGALAEVIGSGGLLVECNSPNALGEMMWSLLENPLLREHLKVRGSERVKCFSWKNCAERTVEAYDQVLRVRHAPGQGH